MEQNELARARQRMESAQTLYETVALDLKKLRELPSFIRDSGRRMSALSEYYGTKWLADNELLEQDPDTFFQIMDEDSIFDALTDRDRELRQILREAAVSISEDDELSP